jgi:CxxC motif-containing protein (DUF1111 family)
MTSLLPDRFSSRTRTFFRANRKIVWFGVLLLSGIFLFAETTTPEPGEEFSGGRTTVFDRSRNAFSLSARNLSAEHRAPFFVGNSFFNENWLAATASTSDRDGLGPLFISRSCSACHAKDGRGAPPEADMPTETMVVRISIPGKGDDGGPKPDPVYGLQLQTHSLPEVKPEAQVLAAYRMTQGSYRDGEAYYLRQPVFQVTDLGYGPLSSNVVISPLVSPAVIGLGLLEAVPDETLQQRARQNQLNGHAISGKVNRVWDASAKHLAVGRFGWKAEQPSVRQQCAAAFNGDMGLTTSLFPNENYTAAENVCTNSPSGGHPEVSDSIFDAIVLYSRLLAVPARRDMTNETVLRGEALFQQLDCAVCHVPKLETGEVAGFPELSHQTIHPYTDLLLHDMGEGLADRRQVFEAGGSEWRTPPLWGIGLVSIVNGHNFFLHDGRARGFAEAILWHGGEATASKEQFRQLTRADRDALLRFLESL